MNGALAQLIPHRVPAAGEGGNTLAFFGAERPDGERVHLQRARRRHLGRHARGRRERRPREPVRSLAANIPVEVAETEWPIVVERYGLVTDSGGAGRTAAGSRSSGSGAASRPTRRCTCAPTVRCTARTASPAAGRARSPSNLLFRADGTRGAHAADVRDDARRPATSSTTGWPAAAAGAIRSSATPTRCRRRPGREGRRRGRARALRRRRRRDGPREEERVKITARRRDAARAPARQEFHWACGAQLGANLVLFAVHTDDGVAGYGESICEDPRAVVALRRADGAEFVGRSPGDVEAIRRSIWSEGRWKTFPQFTQSSAGIEAACWDALGRALGVPARTFFGGARARRARLLRLPAGRRRPRRSRRTRASCRRGLRGRSTSRSVGPATTTPCRRRVREAIGAGPAAAGRSERGVGRGDAVDRIRRLEAVRPRLGRAAGRRHGDVAGLAHVRRSRRARRSRPTRRSTRPPSCGTCSSRRRPTRSCRAATTRAASALPPAGVHLPSLRAERQPARVHGERDLSFAARRCGAASRT